MVPEWWLDVFAAMVVVGMLILAGGRARRWRWARVLGWTLVGGGLVLAVLYVANLAR